MREYFRMAILARVSGNERAAWEMVVTSVIRGRRVRFADGFRSIPWAESPAECLSVAHAIMSGEAEFV
jgi:hypothetical protein